jgi:periplasmic divalent cation tolerance protein
MKSSSKFSVVFVTAPDLKTGRQISQAALKARLIACANLMPKIESHYWWRGKIEQSSEILIIMKTRAVKLPALEKLVLKLHPYDTPELVALPLKAGTKRYLDWLADSVS